MLMLSQIWLKSPQKTAPFLANACRHLQRQMLPVRVRNGMQNSSAFALKQGVLR